MIEEKTRVPNDDDPILYEIVASDGCTHGPFESVQEAAEYARHEFPGQEQDEERSGKGWDVQVVGCER